jgi:hypothetical protein
MRTLQDTLSHACMTSTRGGGGRCFLNSRLSATLPALYRLYGKGKAVALQAWSGPEDSRKLTFPDYMTTAQDGGKVVSLMHRPSLPQEMLLVLISVRGWVDPRATVRPEGLCQWKIPMTPSGIERATFRFVAQYLNHCATAVPIQIIWPTEIVLTKTIANSNIYIYSIRIKITSVLLRFLFRVFNVIYVKIRIIF